jgi:hypothetical protein
MRKLLWLAPALLLAGCRSEQVVLQSQSVASAPLVATAPGAWADTALTATVAAPRALGPATAIATAKTPSHPAAPTRLATMPHRAVAPKLPMLEKLLVVKPLTKKLTHRLRQRSTEGVAENGLGRIGLFFIGVVLALLAGLGALVNVIFSVGFFTGVGYAAAGLVVLFLLYSLFSGGKKKK